MSTAKLSGSADISPATAGSVRDCGRGVAPRDEVVAGIRTALTAVPSAPLSTVWGGGPADATRGVGGVGQGVGVDREAALTLMSPVTSRSVRGCGRGSSLHRDEVVAGIGHRA